VVVEQIVGQESMYAWNAEEVRDIVRREGVNQR
jgi:hypothetical protein